MPQCETIVTIYSIDVALLFVTLLIKGLTRWLLTVMIIVGEEVEAKNFVLYIGHLGQRELVVQPISVKS